jgi:hypothetical protein
VSCVLLQRSSKRTDPLRLGPGDPDQLGFGGNEAILGAGLGARSLSGRAAWGG